MKIKQILLKFDLELDWFKPNYFVYLNLIEIILFEW